jgi:hypothetical protein
VSAVVIYKVCISAVALLSACSFKSCVQVVNKSIHQSKPRLKSHTHTRDNIVSLHGLYTPELDKAEG